ncbi:hypothetical protein Hanom_Chr02g00100481 [Helianthus anomalus]
MRPVYNSKDWCKSMQASIQFKRLHVKNMLLRLGPDFETQMKAVDWVLKAHTHLLLLIKMKAKLISLFVVSGYGIWSRICMLTGVTTCIHRGSRYWLYLFGILRQFAALPVSCGWVLSLSVAYNCWSRNCYLLGMSSRVVSFNECGFRVCTSIAAEFNMSRNTRRNARAFPLLLLTLKSLFE